MDIWDKLQNSNLKEQDYYLEQFYILIDDIKKGSFNYIENKQDKGKYFIIFEENRMNSYFLYIVPKELYALFKEMQLKAKNQFLGYTILIGKYQNKDLRVSCFGVECSKFGKKKT